MLSDSSTGVYFNDYSKISVDHGNKTEFNLYLNIKGTKTDLQEVHKVKDCPPELKKKLDLWTHFSKYLHKSESAKKSKLEPQSNPIASKVFVKKCVKTSHGLIFCLSNQIV
jgi:uncharacterized Zn-finger protein